MRTAAKFQARALAYVTRNGFCTDKQLATITGFPINATRKHLISLCKTGLIHRDDKPEGYFARMAFRSGARPVESRAPMHIADPCALPRDFFRRGVSV